MPHTFLRIWDKTGGVAVVDPTEEPRLDAAVSKYVDSACTQDTVLHLATLEGSTYVMLASQASSWLVSSPESRANHAKIDAELCREEESNVKANSDAPWDIPGVYSDPDDE